jgi:hypothetical protein
METDHVAEGIVSVIRSQLEYLYDKGYVMWQSNKNGEFYVTTDEDYEWATDFGEYPERNLERAGRFLIEV